MIGHNAYRTDCFAAVIISIVATMHVHWDMTVTVPQPSTTTTTILRVLLRKKHRAVTLVKNIVQIFEQLRLVLGLTISVTLWGVTRLKLLGIEQRRTALTFLDTFETFLQQPMIIWIRSYVFNFEVSAVCSQVMYVRDYNELSLIIYWQSYLNICYSNI